MVYHALTSGIAASLFAVFAAGGLAHADEMADARSAGLEILAKLEQKQNTEVWRSHVSDWFKDRMTEDAFLANMTIMQAQLGAPSKGRKLVQQNKADGNPQAGYSGAIFSFTFDTTFPAAKVYEVIVLIREAGTYKLSGLNYVPNPN